MDEAHKRVRVTAPDGVELDVAVHPATPARGTALLVHGISSDLDEGGAFARLAARLAEEGLTAVRFSFRGHGRSGGSPQGVTIAGEMLDLEAVADYAAQEWPGPLTVVAASFGAVATGLSLPWLSGRLAGLVLWNPVLDLRRTFLEPELPWGLANFGPEQQAELAARGQLPMNGRFPLGRVLFTELAHYRPLDAYAAAGTPALVVHGDRDGHVSFDIAREAAAAVPGWDFHPIPGADHGFHSPEHEPEAIAVTARRLSEACRRPATHGGRA